MFNFNRNFIFFWNFWNWILFTVWNSFKFKFTCLQFYSDKEIFLLRSLDVPFVAGQIKLRKPHAENIFHPKITNEMKPQSFNFTVSTSTFSRISREIFHRFWFESNVKPIKRLNTKLFLCLKEFTLGWRNLQDK